MNITRVTEPMMRRGGVGELVEWKEGGRLMGNWAAGVTLGMGRDQFRIDSLEKNRREDKYASRTAVPRR